MGKTALCHQTPTLLSPTSPSSSPLWMLLTSAAAPNNPLKEIHHFITYSYKGVVSKCTQKM